MLAKLSRRHILGGAAACGCSMLSPLSCVAEPAPVFSGCLISPAGFATYQSQAHSLYSASDGLIDRSRHVRTTGDDAVDRDLDRALGIIADLFQVNPAFGFYDPALFRGGDGIEANLMNAFAEGQDTDIPGTRCTVAFGSDLFQREFYQYDSTGLTIMTIAAHEFGHVMQFQRGLMGRLMVGNPHKCEINADFLAGYFLGNRKRAIPSLSFAKTEGLFQRIGDYRGPDRTHGKPQERMDAAEAGFRIAYVDRKPLEDAVAAGLEYVGA